MVIKLSSFATALSGLLLIVVSIPLLAGPMSNLRCGSRLVEPGNSTSKLINFCGQPTSVESKEDRIPVETVDQASGRTISTIETRPYQVWIYNFGPSRLVTRVTVRNNMVESMESAGYGW